MQWEIIPINPGEEKMRVAVKTILNMGNEKGSH